MPSPSRVKILMLLTLFAVAAMAFAGSSPRTATLHADAAVWAYRDAHPGAAIPVIVQSDASTDPRALVTATGGVVQSDLGIIHAVAADVPADRLPLLASARNTAWISLDGPVSSTDDHSDGDRDRSAVAAPANVYPQEIGADHLWNDGDQGQGLAVAVVDTGIVNSRDFGDRRIVATISKDRSPGDGYGHGSHVAGLIGGDGTRSDGRYEGVAPQTNLVNVKVGDNTGAATVSDVINGLEFVLENQHRYNIRVVNLSLRTDIAQSYTTDPLDAAVELLTFRGILVVVAAGNTGTVSDAVSYAPANDPFVLTVGAVDDAGTPDIVDDAVPSWSSRGTTQDGIAKPEVYAPGRHLVSVLSPRSVLAQEMSANIVGRYYLQLSGTSMAAGVASGAAALVIHQHPDWTPGQVKQALVQGSADLPADSSASIIQVDASAALEGVADPTPNTKPNLLLLRAAGFTNPESIRWGSIRWGSIKWGSIRWGSIRWGSIRWGSIRWGVVPE